MEERLPQLPCLTECPVGVLIVKARTSQLRSQARAGRQAGRRKRGGWAVYHPCAWGLLSKEHAWRNVCKSAARGCWGSASLLGHGKGYCHGPSSSSFCPSVNGLRCGHRSLQSKPKATLKGINIHMAIHSTYLLATAVVILMSIPTKGRRYTTDLWNNNKEPNTKRRVYRRPERHTFSSPPADAHWSRSAVSPRPYPGSERLLTFLYSCD